MEGKNTTYFMFKYFLVLKVLLGLTDFNAIVATEQTIFTQITRGVQKVQNTTDLISCSIHLTNI